MILRSSRPRGRPPGAAAACAAVLMGVGFRGGCGDKPSTGPKPLGRRPKARTVCQHARHVTPAAAIDLNADVGEGFGSWSMGDDAALLPLLSSANVACGFHAGDATIMRRTCEQAVGLGVRIGAHVGYRDLAGFGRRELTADPATLRDETLYQLGALQACAVAAGGAVTYVKPHGALYHRAASDAAVADAVVDGVRAGGSGLAVVGAPASELLRRAAEAGLPAVVEGFVDRAYRPDGTLLPRSQPGAVLEPEAALEQAVRIATDGA